MFVNLFLIVIQILLLKHFLLKLLDMFCNDNDTKKIKTEHKKKLHFITQ